MPRDNFTEATKRLLAERVGYKCSNPFCKRTTIGPQNGFKGVASIEFEVYEFMSDLK